MKAIPIIDLVITYIPEGLHETRISITPSISIWIVNFDKISYFIFNLDAIFS